MPITSSIDIGTNSTRLLIAEHLPGGTLKPVRYEERITQLGEGLADTGSLKVEAIARVRAALEEYSGYIDEAGSGKPKIVATSAARDASNSHELFSAVLDATGAECSVISGEREAKLTALGVMSDLPPVRRFIICDPGGGSTEFIDVVGGNINEVKSIDVGSRRLTERFIRSDPPVHGETDALRTFLRDELEGTPGDTEMDCELLVGVGGTATSAAAMVSAERHDRIDSVHRTVISLEQIEQIIQKLSSLSLDERRKMAGLNPKRADVIITGLIILSAILERYRLSSFTVSERDILFGLLLEETE